MDERVEAFLADILALEGKDANAIRQGVRVALADCEQIFRAQEANKRMRGKAAHACHALCRARVIEEMRLRKRTTTAEHVTAAQVEYWTRLLLKVDRRQRRAQQA